MYTPTYFGVDDATDVHRLIDAHPFATLIALADGEPFVSHLPMLLETGKDGSPRLVGHMARRNPQWEILEKNPEALVIFQGPHTYVTPRWYAQHDVPTWNYAVVHVRGTVRTLDRHQDLVAILAKLSERMEADAAEPWRFGLPDDLKGEGKLAAAIVGFEIPLATATVHAKFKLSQNRSAADRAGVIEGLATRSDDDSRGVRELMRKHSSKP